MREKQNNKLYYDRKIGGGQEARLQNKLTNLVGMVPARTEPRLKTRPLGDQLDESVWMRLMSLLCFMELRSIFVCVNLQTKVQYLLFNVRIRNI